MAQKGKAGPRLENAVKEIIQIFVDHANGDGKLSKEELKNLFDKEIECAEAKAKICAGDCDKIMRLMDKNRNKEIEFKEYLRAVAFIAKGCYQKKTGRDQEDDD
ncbi:protein S100-A5-like [Centropristis striata]|uniref:protein S100-A5-like n=1 Tax=Centropristis striata TaxID=184440 RepID=UPI0027DEB2EA|nr:protein S100-A5-like [Centropristis striata]